MAAPVKEGRDMSGNNNGGLKFELSLKQAKEEEKKADNKLVYVGIFAAAILLMFILSISAQASPYESPRPDYDHTSGQHQIPYQLPNGGGAPPRTPLPTLGR
jgi:hypothetical protein